MSPPIRVRFAPSPTGLLHKGSAHTALFNWLFARRENGSFLLRIEDTDTARSRQEWIDGILNSLQWMGIHWDEDVVYQSSRLKQHLAWAEALIKQGKAYRCYYLLEEIEEKKKQAISAGNFWRNDRKYAEISSSEAERLEAEGRRSVIRLKIPEGETVFEDRILGKIEVKNETIDDFVIVRSNGTPLYHLAVVVDDMDMNISHVIRGIDHLTNTTKHIQIFQAIGANIPEFAHLPSILGEDKKKLSKRHGAVSVTEYQDAGYLSDTVVNFLSLLGWQTGDDQEYFTRSELLNRFMLDQVHKRDTVFDLQKFEWLNGQHIMALPNEDLWLLLKPFLIKERIIEPQEEIDYKYAYKVVSLLKDRCRTLVIFAEQSRVFFSDNFEYNLKGVIKHWSKDPEKVIQRLEWLRDELISLKIFNTDTIDSTIRELSNRHSLKLALFIHPCRIALTGQTAGPSLFDLIAVIGKETSISRLNNAIRDIPKLTNGKDI